MRELDWWDIGGQGLKIPYYQWPTLLVCVASASAVTILFVFAAVGGSLWFSIPDHSFFNHFIPYLLPVLGTIWLGIFQWSWMTALWHNSLKHCLTFPIQKAFWQFVAVSLLLLAADLAIVGARDLLQQLISNRVSPGRGSSTGHSMIALGTVLSQAGLHVFLLARLMIWPAYTVARREFVSPIKIWQATSGLLWDFVFLQLRVQIPVAFIGVILSVITLLIVRSTMIFIAVGAIFAIYGAAAMGAAMLLAYFEVIGKRQPALLPAY
ncbi:hypothetical protein [Dongia sp.]|uniref:hypothetical protein n=1 Tax=Dongia sp. TaxID=1977262 RepID=UPI0035B2EDAF